VKQSTRSATGAGLVQVATVKTSARTEIKDITAEINRLIQRAGVESGLCCLYVPHTTAGILVNESADPDVAVDIGNALDRLVPRDAGYRHYEGNADSHVKSSLVGVSETIPIEGGRLALGRWQGVFFCEFDGPRQRQVRVKILPD
jgi:secondary thiamine-phosphate synthase enzyme